MLPWRCMASTMVWPEIPSMGRSDAGYDIRHEDPVAALQHAAEIIGQCLGAGVAVRWKSTITRLGLKRSARFARWRPVRTGVAVIVHNPVVGR